MEDMVMPVDYGTGGGALCVADLFEALMALAQNMQRTQDFDSLLRSTLAIVLRFTGFEYGAVHLLNDQEDGLYLASEVSAKADGSYKIDFSSCPDDLSVSKVFQETHPIYIEDSLADLETVESGRSLNFRARVTLPLLAAGHTQGVLDLFGSKARPFSPQERYLFEALAVNVSSLLTAARLYTQTQAANAHLMGMNEFGSRIMASESFSQALELTVRCILEATRAHSAMIYLLDSKGKAIQRFGLNQAGQQIVDEPMPRMQGTTSSIHNLGKPIVVSGFELGAHKEIHPFLRSHGIRATIGLPLKRGNNPAIGVLYVRYDAPHMFSPPELEGLTLFAAQATGAIEYLRLLEESRRREVDLGILVDTAHLLISTLDMDELLQQIAVRLAWVTGMSSCAISSFTKDPDHLILLAQYSDLGEPKLENVNKICYLDDFQVTRSILETGQPILVRVDDPDADVSALELLKAEGYECMLMLPMKSGDRPVGLLELYSSRKEVHFSEGDFRRLKALSEQIALAMVNARHYTEEQRARLTAETLRHATAALNSTLELNQVLDLILEQLQQVVYFDSATLMLLEDHTYSVAAVRGDLIPGSELSVKAPLGSHPLAEAVVTSRESIIVDDTSQDERWRCMGISDRASSLMAVPLITRGEVIGLLAIYSHTSNVYKPADAIMAQTFAGQAALAVANARLYQVEQKHRALYEALSEISLALSSSLDSNAALEILVEQIGRAVPYDSCCVMMLEGESVRVASQRGFERFGIMNLSELIHPVSESPNLNHMAVTLRSYFIADVHTDPTWVKTKSSHHVGSWLGAPLVARGKLLGFLSLDKVDRKFYTSEHAAHLGILVGHAALALDNAMTYTKVELASITDFLTNSYNHRFFQQQIREEIERAYRQGHQLSLLMVDIDHFKLVNDTYGHMIGDQVLRRVAARLKTELRAYDILSRYGGEEFAIILPGTTAHFAGGVAERLRKAVSANPCEVGDWNIDVTISVGIATYPGHAEEAQDLIAAADAALYQAKEEGRNRIHLTPEPEPGE